MPNPFALIDRLDFDFDLPPAPAAVDRADSWFNRLSELQRIGVALLLMLFLAASAFYCLGLGSTVLVNRAEAEIAAQQAEIEAAVPTAVPTVQPTEAPTALATATAQPTQRTAARPTQVVEYPTPIPPQFLPTVPIQPAPAQRAAAPADVPTRPRIVAPYEPPTPTPPIRSAAPAAPRSTTAPAPGSSGSTGAPVRAATPTPAFTGPAILPRQTPVTGGTRVPATSAPATKPVQPAPAATTAPKPTSGSIFNPIATVAPRSGTGSTPVSKPSISR